MNIQYIYLLIPVAIYIRYNPILSSKYITIEDNRYMTDNKKKDDNGSKYYIQ